MSSVSTYFEQRTLVDTLLREGTDSKLLRAGSKRAQEKLEAAYIASRRPQAIKPWCQLTAYRLAHVMLRSASNADLVRIYGLLKEAAEDYVLGPVPIIYQLASLHRLRECASTKKERLEYGAKIVPTFQEARKVLTRKSQNLETLGDELHARLPVQGVILNLLEFASYIFALPYDDLEGLRTPYEDLHLGGLGWHLVTREEKSRVALPLDLAKTKLDDYGKRNPATVLFRLSKGYKAELSQIKYPGRRWEELPSSDLRLLACLVRGRCPRERLLRYVFEEKGQSNENLRQAKKRLKESLEIGLSSSGRFIEQHSLYAFTLANNVAITGIVQEQP